jgi:hypothetical protein
MMCVLSYELEEGSGSGGLGGTRKLCLGTAIELQHCFEAVTVNIGCCSPCMPGDCVWPACVGPTKCSGCTVQQPLQLLRLTQSVVSPAPGMLCRYSRFNACRVHLWR